MSWLNCNAVNERWPCKGKQRTLFCFRGLEPNPVHAIGMQRTWYWHDLPPMYYSQIYPKNVGCDFFWDSSSELIVGEKRDVLPCHALLQAVLQLVLRMRILPAYSRPGDWKCHPLLGTVDNLSYHDQKTTICLCPKWQTVTFQLRLEIIQGADVNDGSAHVIHDCAESSSHLGSEPGKRSRISFLAEALYRETLATACDLQQTFHGGWVSLCDVRQCACVYLCFHRSLITSSLQAQP